MKTLLSLKVKLPLLTIVLVLASLLSHWWITSEQAGKNEQHKSAPNLGTETSAVEKQKKIETLVQRLRDLSSRFIEDQKILPTETEDAIKQDADALQIEIYRRDPETGSPQSLYRLSKLSTPVEGLINADLLNKLGSSDSLVEKPWPDRSLHLIGIPLQIKETGDSTFAFGLYDVKEAPVPVIEASLPPQTFDYKAALDNLVVHANQHQTFLIGLFVAVFLISLLFAMGLARSLKLLSELTRRIAKGESGLQLELRRHDEIGTLGNDINTMSVEVAKVIKETRTRADSEANIAKAAQDYILPEGSASYGDFELAGGYEPSPECGGDWWSSFEQGEYVYVFIGDVTGYGAPAAILASAARAVTSIVQSMNLLSPAQIMYIMNQTVSNSSKGKLNMTVFIGQIHKPTGTLVYCNASHEYPFAVASGGEIDKNSFRLLMDVNNPRLGEQRDLQFKEGTIQLQPKDVLILFTDGVTEVVNSEKKNWGERRFLKSLTISLQENRLSQSVKSVIRDVQKFRGQQRVLDDITLVMVRYNSR